MRDSKDKSGTENSSSTLEYRINGGGVRIIGGFEMVRYNNNRGVGTIGGKGVCRN